MAVHFPATEECCKACRRPVATCTGVSCDDAGTYAAVLHDGQWREDDAFRAQALRPVSGRLAPATVATA